MRQQAAWCHNYIALANGQARFGAWSAARSAPRSSPLGVIMWKKHSPRSEDQVGRARVAAKAAIEDLPGSMAFLGGSPLAGLGTPRSDVDIFIVGDEKLNTRQIISGDVRLDIEFIQYENFKATISNFSTFRVTHDDIGQLQEAQYSTLDCVVRFMLGEILLDDDGRLFRLMSQAYGSVDAIEKLAVARHAVFVGNRTEDAQGALEVGDLLGAQYLGREAMLCAAEAFLTTCGDPYFGPKWVWTRWARTVGDDIGMHASRVIADAAVPPSTSLSLSQDLLIQAITGVSYDTVAAENGSPRRAEFVVPHNVAGGVLLAMPSGAQARVSIQGAALWGLAHGRDPADAVDLGVSLLGASANEVRTYYHSLVRHALILDSRIEEGKL